MTVHAVLVVCAPSQQSSPSTEPSPSPPDWKPSLLADRLTQNVFDTHTEVLTGQSSDFSEIALDVTDHYRALHRVDWASNKTALLDDVEQGGVADAEWYEIRYHQCDHDAAQPIPACPDWTAERSYGTVPSDV